MSAAGDKIPVAGGDAGAYLEPALTTAMRVKYLIGFALWLLLVLYFWIWWLSPEHNLNTFRYILVTMAVGWIFMMQLYFLAIFLRASRSASDIKDLNNPRVAMIVTKTPSEPFSVVRKTLEAMLTQDYYPSDTWLADEDPTEETIAWCEKNGVRISTRKGREDYHRAEWPRRTRCKEGNLAFFYDHFGYENYDFVSQLDADHVPQPGYLEELLKPFADPGVGYVSAPSICSGNADKSWAARTRLYSEAMFHGVLQGGYSNRWAPMCIGSHYAVRTKALKEIGGLGPELAEDHSTSLIMNSHGWRGVHAIDAIAYGDGPATFSDMLTQEFQWSRSLVTLLLRYTPRYFSGLRPRLKFQFVFSQLWYPLFAGFMLMTFMIPIMAILFDVRFADVTYPGFVGHIAPSTLLLIWIAYQIRRDGFFRPRDAKVISWERTLFTFAQWPWVLLGCIMAVRDSLFGKFVDFRITPKGRVPSQRLPYKVILPYLFLAIMSIFPVLVVNDVSDAAGFFLLSLMNAVAYSILVAVVVLRHVVENGIRWRLNPFYHGAQFATAAMLLVLTVSSVWLRGLESLHSLATGLDPLQVTDAQFVVSGAGQAKPGTLRYFLSFDWNN